MHRILNVISIPGWSQNRHLSNAGEKKSVTLAVEPGLEADTPIFNSANWHSGSSEWRYLICQISVQHIQNSNPESHFSASFPPHAILMSISDIHWSWLYIVNAHKENNSFLNSRKRFDNVFRLKHLEGCQGGKWRVRFIWRSDQPQWEINKASNETQKMPREMHRCHTERYSQRQQSRLPNHRYFCSCSLLLCRSRE